LIDLQNIYDYWVQQSINNHRERTMPLILLMLFSFSIQSYAADTVKLKQLFESLYNSEIYQQRRCTENIERFIKYAKNEQINLDNSFLLSFENKGIDTFGMINAHKARNGGKLKNINDNKFEEDRFPGELNWYYHVVLIAD
jgi:hypothetical protein